MSAQHLTRDICLARDICLFQGGQTHMQSELLQVLQETGAKKGCGKRGGAGGGNLQRMPFWLPSAIAWHVCVATLKKTYIPREMFGGHVSLPG